MYLFKIFHSFLPLRNPFGFGASDWVVLAIAILLVGLISARAMLAPYALKLSSRTVPCMVMLFALSVILRLALLPQSPVPVPSGADDFAYLLSGDTLSHFRLANVTHPLHPFFEAVFVLQQPAYASIYPLGQGLVLAFGQLILHSSWAGILLSSGALAASCYWMLRGWVAPVWALSGGMLAVIQFGPLNPWVNSYWGGYVSAIAGCLVFGALPRFRESPRLRYALLLGGGLALQILTRPFEAIFLLLAAALYLAFAFHKTVIFALVPIAAALLLTLLQNHAVTRSWTTLPYMLSRYEYGVPATFTFQPNPVPHRALTAEQQLDYQAQSAIHGAGTDTPADYLHRLTHRARYVRFFMLPPLYLAALAFVPLVFRHWRYAWAAGTVLLFALGTNFYPYFFSQYVAALTCLFVLISVLGLQRLGEAARISVLTLCGASFIFWYGLSLSGNENLLPLTAYQSWNYINRGDPQGRSAIQSQLEKAAGRQLVFVRYSSFHRFQEWIHNDADIDSARIIWANDLGTEENEKLLGYYANRKTWLVEPDAHPPALTEYPRDSGQFLTVH